MRYTNYRSVTIIKRTIKEINYLCEHLYFCHSGNFKNNKFIEDIIKLRNYFVIEENLKNYFDQIPLFAYAELYNDIDNNHGVYNVVFNHTNNKEEKLKILEKDCDNLYKLRNK